MPQAEEVRLELIKALIPVASRHGFSDPQTIVATATALEQYVLKSAPMGEGTPDSPARRTLTRPRKGQPDDATPAFLTPPMVDKSNQTPG